MPPCAPGRLLVLIASDAVVCGGLVTVSGNSLEAAPSVFFTCSFATAGCASGLPLIFADSVVEFTTVVGTAVPFTIRDGD